MIYSREEQLRGITHIREAWESLLSDFAGISSLKPPVFELGYTKNWGSWNPTTRVFSVHSRLAIFLHKSYAFRDTVAHELAHQWVSEVLRIKEPPHGPSWRAAARLFGANPKATALDQLDEVCGALTPKDEKVAKRIKKLLALSSSPNPHEAELAAMRARELMCRHRLEADATEQRWHYKVIGKGYKRRPRWLHIIANILTDYYQVEAIWIRNTHFAYLNENWSEDWQQGFGRNQQPRYHLEITGRPAAVLVAEHVYAFLIAEGERRLRDYRQAGGGTSHAARLDFLIGLYHGFANKLKAQTETLEAQNQAAQTRGESALVLSKDQSLRAFHEARYPNISYSSSGPRSSGDAAARSEGLRQGQELEIHHAVNDKGDGPKALR